MAQRDAGYGHSVRLLLANSVSPNPPFSGFTDSQRPVPATNNSSTIGPHSRSTIPCALIGRFNYLRAPSSPRRRRRPPSSPKGGTEHDGERSDAPAVLKNLTFLTSKKRVGNTGTPPPRPDMAPLQEQSASDATVKFLIITKKLLSVTQGRGCEKKLIYSYLNEINDLDYRTPIAFDSNVSTPT